MGDAFVAFLAALLWTRHERNNDALVAQGVTPAWSERHPILAFLIGCVLATVLIAGAIVLWAETIIIGGWWFALITPLLIVFGVSRWRYRVAERRWNHPANAPTKVVEVRRGR